MSYALPSAAIVERAAEHDDVPVIRMMRNARNIVILWSITVAI